MIPVSALTSIIMLFSGVLFLMIIMLLPAIIELKKPKDAGPRTLEQSSAHRIILMRNIEDDVRFDWVTVKRVAEVIAVLPSLEP